MHASEGRPGDPAPAYRPPARPVLARRRALGLLGGLATGSLVLLSGCTAGRPEPLPPVREPNPGVDPDVVVATHTLTAERAMLELVNATIDRHAGLRPLLAPVAAVHQAHVQLLTRAVPGSASPSPSATPSGPVSPVAAPPGSPAGTQSPSATGSPSSLPSGAASPTHVPRDPDRAVRQLSRHEADLSLFDKQQAFTARSGGFARLLASMAAAAAQQTVLLGSPPHRSGAGR